MDVGIYDFSKEGAGSRVGWGGGVGMSGLVVSFWSAVDKKGVRVRGWGEDMSEWGEGYFRVGEGVCQTGVEDYVRVGIEGM